MAEIKKPLLAYRTKLPGGSISNCINKIMNTLAFRKLSEKTQVILSLSGPDVRTRLTHTIEVAKIAKDICTNLGLNVELADAIALAHDIGHTPFGHVGERTLREIMCGCDTLDGKVEDFDFDNSGFKHNLQSFRVLHTLDALPNGDDAWPYILWGAIDHTKLSYSEPCADMEKEIYISCQHCASVYNCYFHAKKECKRNILNRQTEISKRTCKPWYCASLELVETKEDCVEYDKEYQDKHGVKAGVLWDELIDNNYFKIKHMKDIYCNEPCYLARLWKHKFDNEDLVNKYKFLFDHPFPNSFYTKKMYEYFFDENITKGWVSVEAQIVKQADEIAQRQEDLEDGITKGLISLEDAHEKLLLLIDEIKFSSSEEKSLKSEIVAANNPEKIGTFIVELYSNLLEKSTKYNLNQFGNGKHKGKINIFCMLNIILSIDKVKRKKWILQELTNIPKSTITRESVSSNILTDYFDIDPSVNNFLFVVYDYLDSLYKTKSSTDKIDTEIIDKYIDCLKINENQVVKEYYNATKKGDGFVIKAA